MATDLLNQAPDKPATNLPDINAETHPFELVQRSLDRAAFLSVFAVADQRHGRRINATDPDDWFRINAGYGIQTSSTLHQFEATTDATLRIHQTIGEKLGGLEMRLWFAPITHTEWRPGREPRPRVFDPWCPQHFVTSAMTLSFGDNDVSCYALGQTFPVTIDGRVQVVLCAVGNVVRASGNLVGLDGTICLQGSLTREWQFQGSVTARLVDPYGVVKASEDPLPRVTRLESDNEKAIRRSDMGTYLCMRIEKERPSDRTSYGPSHSSGLVTLLTPAIMKSLYSYPSVQSGGELRVHSPWCDKIARMEATVTLNILAPPGTDESPNDFDTRNIYSFVNQRGEPVGTITAYLGTGKSFDLKFPDLPRQPGMRFGGFGHIEKGTGCFDGAQGTVIDNSAIGIAPHAVSGMHIIRLIDPSGWYADRVLSSRSRQAARPTVGLRTRSSLDGGPVPQSRLPQKEGVDATAAASARLPDLNAETNPFDRVLEWLDQAALLNCYSIPGSSLPIVPIGSAKAPVGFQITEQLHRFHMALKASEAIEFPKIVNTVGEVLGSFTHRWMFIPEDFHALPTSSIPETRFNPRRSQRFVMLDSCCDFVSGDSFYGFGTGRTYPTDAGRPDEVIVGAVGNIMGGVGSFVGAVGTYTYGGILSPGSGYRGNVLCRVIDAEGRFRTQEQLAPIAQNDKIKTEARYVVVRGQKRDRSVKTTYSVDQSGEVNGLNVQQTLRAFEVDCAATGKLRSRVEVGPVIGDMSARVLFNILNPGAPGTALSPIAFQSINRFRFLAPSGQSIGGFGVDGGEGRTFNMRFPQDASQQGLRFGVFAPMVAGSGAFRNTRGLMTDNSAVGVAPHAVATCYVLRVG